MQRILMLTAMLAVVTTAHAEDWVTIQGRIVFDGKDVPVMKVITPNKDVAVCNKNGEFKEENWIINPKNMGLKNVFVWLAPDDVRGAPFPQDKIHPDLKAIPKEPIIIDQPCCMFIPHATAARVGQSLIIKNSAPIPHNAKWDSVENGSYNPLIPPDGQFKIPNPLTLEPKARVITLACSIHPWMNAWVRTFDHPYFAVTDADGKFVIKNAPKGKFKIFTSHPAGGWKDGAKGAQGETMEIKENVDLKEVKFPKPPE